METSCFIFLFVSYKKVETSIFGFSATPPPPHTHACTDTQHKSAVETLGIVYGMAGS